MKRIVKSANEPFRDRYEVVEDLLNEKFEDNIVMLVAPGIASAAAQYDEAGKKELIAKYENAKKEYIRTLADAIAAECFTI